MLTKILKGIPFLLDPTTKKIYAYEKQPPTDPLCLGFYNPEKEIYELLPNWEQLYEPKLKEYRASIKPFSRLPQAAVAK